MLEHRTRVLTIAALWALVFIGLIVLSAVGQTSGTVFGAVFGVFATLTPALIDALRVEARRVTPGVPAIADDVPARPPAA